MEPFAVSGPLVVGLVILGVARRGVLVRKVKGRPARHRVLDVLSFSEGKAVPILRGSEPVDSRRAGAQTRGQAEPGNGGQGEFIRERQG